MASQKKRKQFMLSGAVPFEVDAKYAPLAVLGDGAYGVVCSCINRETKEAVAVKKIGDAMCNLTTAFRTLREIQILRRIGRHDNIVSLKDVMLSSSPGSPPLKSNFRHVYLVHELMDSDLAGFIKSSSPAGLSRDVVKLFLFRILRGLKFLHSSKIIHRDLKPQNILIKRNCDLKICDYGLARTMPEDEQSMTEYVVTRWYRAPELLTGSFWYGNGVDIWSVGCILAEMLSGKPIFPGETTLRQIDRIYRVLGTPSDLSYIESERFRKYVMGIRYSPGGELEKLFPAADPLVVDLLKKMLVVDPRNRISASQALEHPYFSDIYDPVRDGESSSTVRLEIDEDPGGADEKTIRDLMWKEMLFYRPELNLPDPVQANNSGTRIVGPGPEKPLLGPVKPKPCQLRCERLDRPSRRRRIVL